MTIEKYSVGDVVELKKQHPCGSYQWKITRFGADVKLQCLGCDRTIMIPRIELYKNVTKKLNVSDEK